MKNAAKRTLEGYGDMLKLQVCKIVLTETLTSGNCKGIIHAEGKRECKTKNSRKKQGREKWIKKDW